MKIASVLCSHCLPSAASATGLSVLDETASDCDVSPSVLILAREINVHQLIQTNLMTQKKNKEREINAG